jgi:hypothetical protein
VKKIDLPLFVILFISFFWRFIDYPNRWVLNQDQARDAVIAKYALENHLLPLIGSPSSAGPFNFGPIYDWLIMFFTLIFPFDSGPWVGFTLLSALIPLIFYFIGKSLQHRQLGLFLALIAAFSSAQILNAPDMLNTVITAFFVTLAFLAISQSKFFLLGLSAASAVHSHFQSLGVSALLFSTTIFNRLRPAPQRLGLTIKIATGFLLTFIPLFVFDLQNRFVWIKSVITYYTGGVNKFYYPVRWLTEIRDFWPHLWGNVLTNIPLSGYLFILLFLVSLILSHKSLPKKLPTFILAFLIQVLLVRYYKGTRSREYLIAFHPYFILFTGYSLSLLYSHFKPHTLLLALLIISLATVSNLKIIRQSSQAKKIYTLKQQLDSQYPGQIAIYSLPDYDMASLPIFYLLYRQHRLDPRGTPIAITIDGNNNYLINPLPAKHQLILYQPQDIYNRLFVNYPSALH